MTMDRAAETGYFRQKIRDAYADDLKRMASIPKEAISAILSEDPFGLAPEEVEAIRRQLEFTFSVRQEKGSTIRSDYRPWLQRRRPDIRFHYWNRLRKYYLGDDVLPPNVVSQLDGVTDEILDFCGNPEDTGAWGRRGMVMGHVQSGKTTNYASLISKASDAGYKIIILLAGLTNSLRQQTQERIDEAYIGKKSLFNEVRPELMPVMHFCDQRNEGRLLHPAFGTTRDQDFQKAVSRFGVSLDNLRDPIIFVTKKNKAILQNLLEWIEGQSGGRQIGYPLLLIDDEADNASVNTHRDPGRSTAINDVIRRILTKFSRSSYVGYTATPFANIFIDPDTDDEMSGNDLFPSHFIKALDPPTNYVGAMRIFSPDGNLRDAMLRVVGDYGDILPLRHRRDLQLEELPPSLEKAIRTFILVSAIRILRGDGSKHCSMMINVSRFNDVQEKVHGLVYACQKRLDDAIRVNAGLGADARRDPDINALAETFSEELADVEFGFSDILGALAEASRTIVVRTINMRGGVLDYDRHEKDGLHVIAIGGLALSRGLTLEGLCVSYILRNAGASDTLMQMARWFGYRRNYEDLCRLFICKTSVDHYEYIADAVEELRAELKRMEIRNETPEQFGLKVRRSETGIRITAANKMRTATQMQLAQSFDRRHVEGYALENDAAVNNQNIDIVLDFLARQNAPLPASAFEDELQRKEAEKHLVWRGVDGQSLLEMVRSFRFHADQPSLGLIDGRSSLFIDYCLDRIRDELGEWDVVAPMNAGRQTSLLTRKTLGSVQLPLRGRHKGIVKIMSATEVYKPMGDRNNVRDPREDPPLLLTAALRKRAEELRVEESLRGDRPFCAVRERPLLIVHFFTSDLEDERFRLKNTPIVSLSFCMPETAVPALPRTYEVNAVFRKQIETLSAETDDDEGMLDE
ncbi:MAG: Z1 domain-containing protein [Blastocatellales bacterium]